MIKNQYKSMLISMLSFFIIVTNIFPVHALDNNTSEDNKETEQVIEVVEETVTPEVSVEPVVSESPDIIETSIPEINDPVESVYPESTVVPEVVVTPTPSEETVLPDEELLQQTPEVVSELVYDSGNIYIYNLQQLLAIGTNVPVKNSDNDGNTFGVGEDVYDNDMLITYSLDATYVLMNEISLNRCWNIPEGFSGKFVSGVDPVNHNIYDEETNTIYISNSFQLDLISNFYNGKEPSPILSNDLDVNMFGAGQLVYPTGSDQFLYYDDTHNYVITTSFTEQRPLNDNLQTQIEATVLPEVTPEIETYANSNWGNADLAGRDYVGQVYKKFGESETKYILIGNKQQLAAIGSGKQVTPTLIVYNKPGLLDWTSGYSPLYPGDADLNSDITLILDEKKPENFSVFKNNPNPELMNVDFEKGLLGSLTDLIGGILDGLLGSGSEIKGYDSIKGEYISESDLKKEYQGLKYSRDANYIIFRDIDLENVDWKPLMFSGYMTGAKAKDGTAGSLWPKDVINENQITISNINVNQTTPLDVEKQAGVGFFGTIMSTSGNESLFKSNGLVVVKNIVLNNIKVVNNTNKFANTTDGLIELLTKLLGSLTEILLGNLGKILNNLLNPTVNKTVFATGGFAGRIVGEVRVENCEVKDLTQLSSINDMVGGFAGHIEGVTEYSGLDALLGGVTDVLIKLLSIIPGLDLGTLINVLLNGNIIEIDELIPTGYKSPIIQDCEINQTDVSNNTLVIDGKDQKSIGGFAGNMIGSIVKNSRITSNTLTVNGESFVGGFGGFVSNAEIVGLLSEIGLDLNVLHLNSFIIDSNINAANLSVSARGDYSGGMAGALANSFVVDSSINNSINKEINNATVKISANNYAGGFAGIATVGQTIGLGEFQAGKEKLLKTVSDILKHVIANDKGTILLSLIGVSPSVLAGCQLKGNLTVKANVTGGLNGGGDFAGGLVGRGDGVKIIPSSKLKEKSFIWKEIGDNLKPLLSDNKTILNGIQSVSGNRYVGGLIGEATTASVAGILNQTLGVGNYLGFDIEDVELNFTQDPVVHSVVQATDECAGGLAGRAIGGTITNANVNSLNSVTADNMAGGFIGHGGTGSLAETGGLNILGLIKIDNLVSLADGVVLKINNSNITGGADDGLTVVANGGNNQGTTEVKKYYAGGFIGKSTSVHINNCHVTNLKNVEANKQSGYAGGFAGITETGGLADAANGDTGALKLLDINGLLGAIPYLVSEFRNVTVKYLPVGSDMQVIASSAGGFIGQMQSGVVDNSSSDQSVIEPYAVYNLKNVEGEYYAGGFAGRIVAGGLANANDLSILGGLKLIDGININIKQLLSVLDVYIPDVINAGVLSSENVNDNSTEGLIVKSNSINNSDSNSGSAGGYVGYASGTHIKNSSVRQLRNTKVTAPSDLNDPAGDSYYGSESSYAINAKRYAGGYAGKLDIGNTASLSEGLDILSLVEINNLLEALAVTATKVEHSDVYGAPGGYSVIANGVNDNKIIGNAGGFAGGIYGSQLQNCDSYNFEYIIGKETAGGYVGALEPGDVATAVGKTQILGGILSADNNLATVLESFIPMIYNSQTTCIPCGGAVRADAMSSDGIARGLAGGYVGYNLGGRIEGNSTRKWNGKELAPEVLKESAVYRLRSVYGYEYAGGFSGRSESGSVSDIGSISVLFGLVELNNPLSALNAVYFTDKDTAVYGPLKGLTKDQWNSWVNNVGVNGSYGFDIKPVETDDQLKTMIDKYAYGYEVKAGRDITGNSSVEGGVAGGYVGRMDGGKITSAHVYDLKQTTASRSSGGFAGEMVAAGVANVGNINIAGLDIVGNLPVLQTFVPVIKSSSTIGYKSGATILATGTDTDNFQGNAGGYVGYAVGAQIEGTDQEFCSISKLKTVKGTNNVGGFAGSIITGSAVDVNVGTKDSLLPQILGKLVGDAGKLASVLKAVLSNVKYAKVEAWDDWGVTIDGSYTTDNDPNTKYAYAAGGFVGNFSGSVLGDRESTVDSVIADNIKSVIGGEHVGGFFGLADVAALAQVGDNNSGTILGLIKLGEIDVLDTFRPYIYHGTVNGSVTNGLSVYANTGKKYGAHNSEVYTGNAGGFGGSLLDGSVKNSRVTALNQVKGINNVGGFAGHLGKSGVLDLDGIDVGGFTVIGSLLKSTVGVLDNFGSHIDSSTVSGITQGFTVESKSINEQESKPISGGFVGLADLAKITKSNVTDIKKVSSNEIAGGFVGKTSFSYLVDSVNGSGFLLDPILAVVNALLDILYFDDLPELGVIKIDFLGKILELKVLSDGDVLSVTLLGLKISVALVRDNGDGTSNLAQVHIGDSFIELPCTIINDKDIQIKDDEKTKENLKLGLIKSNRTTIKECEISGINIGYDVFGGNATEYNDGASKNGIAGGFVGFNEEGMLQNNTMYFTDTIRGTADNVGPFTGKTSLTSDYPFNKINNIEGPNTNKYHVYRDLGIFDHLFTNKGEISSGDKSDGIWNRFEILHIDDVIKYNEFDKAYVSDGNNKKDAGVYISDAKAVLMNDTRVSDNNDTVVPPPSDMQDPCVGTINLTINKVWNDFGNEEKLRPDSITVKLTRYYIDNGVEILDSGFSKEIIINGHADNNIWQHVEEGLDAYKIDSEGNNQAYYKYKLEEVAVNGYASKIEYSDDGFTITITNTHTPLLPETGGSGTLWFTVIGLVGIISILISYNRRRKVE